MIVNFRHSRICVLLILIGICSNISLLSVQAQTADLQTKIDQRNIEIKNLEKEIAEFQKQINTLAGQASSLAATIKSLYLTQKKLAADIALTESKIAA